MANKLVERPNDFKNSWEYLDNSGAVVPISTQKKKQVEKAIANVKASDKVVKSGKFVKKGKTATLELNLANSKEVVKIGADLVDETKAVTAEKVRAQKAEKANADAVKALEKKTAEEVTRAKDAEQANAKAIAKEASRANDAETELDSKVLAEGKRALAAEEALDSNIAETKSLATVKSGDIILVQDKDGISSELMMELIKENDVEYLVLKGANGVVISKIDVDSFIKDGMIDSVVYDKDTNSIVIKWNADSEKDTTTVDLSSLIDVYEGAENEIVINGKVVSLADAVKEKISKNAEDITAETMRAKDAENAIDERVKELESKKFVEYKENPSDPNRKHIALANHDSVIGTAKDGTEYNLAMVSKWDVADFGSSSIHMNLNSKDGEITINDNTKVATEPWAEGKVTAEEARAKAAEAEVESKVSDEASRATGVENALDSRVKELEGKSYVEYEQNPSDTKRKHISLDNYDSILGKDTEGGEYNLAMVSKWNVADFGSSAIHMNLNSKDGEVTINDNVKVATQPWVNDEINTLKERITMLEDIIKNLTKVEGDDVNNEPESDEDNV